MYLANKINFYSSYKVLTTFQLTIKEGTIVVRFLSLSKKLINSCFCTRISYFDY